MTTLLKGWFKNHSFPNIQTVVLPSCAHEVLRSCTGARCVIPIDVSPSKLVLAIRAWCPKVESLSNFRPDAALIKREYSRAIYLHCLMAHAHVHLRYLQGSAYIAGIWHALEDSFINQPNVHFHISCGCF